MATILIDMDDTILDLKGAWIEEYNKRLGTTHQLEDMTDWDLSKKFGPEIYEILQNPGFFRSLEPYPNAIEVIERLSKKHEIIVVTASVIGHSMKEKGEWFQEHLGFLGEDNFMIARKKYKIQGDVLFDDGPHNIELFKGVTMALRHHHNEEADPDYWVDDMLHFERLVERLYASYHVLG